MTEIFSHFFQPCFDQICLLPKQSQVQTTADAFASGVGGGGAAECRRDGKGDARDVWRVRFELYIAPVLLCAACVDEGPATF